MSETEAAWGAAGTAAGSWSDPRGFVLQGRAGPGGGPWPCSHTAGGVKNAGKEQRVSESRLEDRLKAMLVERLMLKFTPDEIGDTDDLIEKWGLESVQLMEIVIGLEEVFGIQLGDDEFSVKKFRTVLNIAAVVREKQPGA